MPNRKQLLISAGIVLALAVVYFLWQRGWVLEQASSILVLLADSLTVAGALAFLAGFFLRGRTRVRPKLQQEKPETEPADLTGEDLERGRKTRRRWGNALFLCAAVAIALSVLISVIYTAL